MIWLGISRKPAIGGVHWKHANTVTWLSGMSLPVSSLGVVLGGGHGSEDRLDVGSIPPIVHFWNVLEVPSGLTGGASTFPLAVRYPDQHARSWTEAGLVPQMLARPADVINGQDGGGSQA